MDNNQTQLDPTSLILTKAIGMQENGGQVTDSSYTQLGDNNTSAGAYQWNNGKTPLQTGQIPANFKSDAQKYGLDPTDFSPQNQNQVAYSKVKDLLSKGLTPAQVASSWNAGLGEPDAWKGTFSDGSSSKTSNFDVPGYVAGVQKYAQQLEGQTNTQQGQPTQQPQQSNDNPLEQFAVGVGSDVLGVAHSIGSMLGLKPTPFGQKLLSSSQNLDNGGYKTAGQVAGYALPAIAGGVGLIGGATSGVAEGTALGSDVVQNIFTDDLGPGESLDDLSAADKQNTLYNALQNADAGEKPLIQQAMKENIANIMDEAGVDNPSQITQQVAQKSGISSKVWSLMKSLGWITVGGNIENQIWNKATGLIQGAAKSAIQSGQSNSQTSKSMYPIATYSP